MINKPKNIGEFDVLVIRKLKEAPLTTQDPMNPTYSASILASNEFEGTVLVYASSSTKKGIKDFLDAYPDAEVREDSTFEEPEKWKSLAFPEQSDTETVLDAYYMARHKDSEIEMRKKLIKEGKNK